MINLLKKIKHYLKRVIFPRRNYFFYKEIHKYLEPISPVWGFDRGIPVDRYYIETFIKSNSKYIKGKCLEVLEPVYTNKFGTGVLIADAIDIDTNNKKSTIYGDLRSLNNIADGVYDCIVLTQVLNMIDDVESVISECHRILKKEGTLLVTVPGISPFLFPEFGYFRFTINSAKYLFEKMFSQSNLIIESFGNILSAQAFLAGASQEDLTKEELEYNDERFPVVVCIRAVK